RRSAGPAGREEQLRTALAVAAELEAEEAALRYALHDDRAGSVPEENGGATVAPVEDPREDVPTDHQRVACQSCGDHAVALGDCVHEAGATGGEVVGGRIRRAELVGDDRPGG